MEVYFGENCAYPFHVPKDNFQNAKKKELLENWSNYLVYHLISLLLCMESDFTSIDTKSYYLVCDNAFCT